MWCKFGHVTLGYPRQRNPRTPPSGRRIPSRCRAKTVHMRQSRPDSGLGLFTSVQSFIKSARKRLVAKRTVEGGFEPRKDTHSQPLNPDGGGDFRTPQGHSLLTPEPSEKVCGSRTRRPTRSWTRSSVRKGCSNPSKTPRRARISEAGSYLRLIDIPTPKTSKRCMRPPPSHTWRPTRSWSPS